MSGSIRQKPPGGDLPRAGVIWTPLSGVSIKALYGQVFRAPSLDENLLMHPGLRGSLNLLPEKVENIDLGISFQGNRVQAGVDYFDSRQADSVVTIYGTPCFTPILGKLRLTGGDRSEILFSKGLLCPGIDALSEQFGRECERKFDPTSDSEVGLQGRLELRGDTRADRKPFRSLRSNHHQLRAVRQPDASERIVPPANVLEASIVSSNQSGTHRSCLSRARQSRNR
jgi:hypothetical protein